MAQAREIAAWLGVEGSGKADGGIHSGAELSEVSAIDAANQDSVVFAIDAKTLALAVASKAGLILAGPAALTAANLAEQDPRIIAVPDARFAFAMVAKRLGRSDPLPAIHGTATVDPSVVIGQGTKIGPMCVLGKNVIIGRDSEIGPNVTIYPETVLGDRVHVQAGAVLGSRGFGYALDSKSGEYMLFPQQGTLVIGDDVDIGANTTIDRGALGETRIGSGSKLDNLVHIGHNCVIGKNVIIAAQTGISGSSVIEDGAILGGQVGIGEHAIVGQGVILGGGAGVLSGKKMHGPGEVFWGRPARPLRDYLKDLARLKRR